MAIGTGDISLEDIDAEYGLGLNLESYRGTVYQDISPDGNMEIKQFPVQPNAISFDDFLNTRVAPIDPYITPAIQITTQPQTITTFEGTSTLVFSVEFEVNWRKDLDPATRPEYTSTISYIQWQESTDGGTVWNDMSGEDGSTLSVLNDIGNAGYLYRARIEAHKIAPQSTDPYDAISVGPPVVVAIGVDTSNVAEADIQQATGIPAALSSEFLSQSAEAIQVTNFFRRDGITQYDSVHDAWNLTFRYEIQAITSLDAPGRSPVQVTDIYLQYSGGNLGPWTNITLGPSAGPGSLSAVASTTVAITPEITEQTYIIDNIANGDQDGTWYRLYLDANVSYTDPTESFLSQAASTPVELVINETAVVDPNALPSYWGTDSRRDISMQEGNTHVFDADDVGFDLDGDTMEFVNVSITDDPSGNCTAVLGLGNSQITFTAGTGSSDYTNGRLGDSTSTLQYQLKDSFGATTPAIGITVFSIAAATPESSINNISLSAPADGNGYTLNVLNSSYDYAGGALTLVSVGPVTSPTLGSVFDNGNVAGWIGNNIGGQTSFTFIVEDTLARQYQATCFLRVIKEPVLASILSSKVTTSPITISAGTARFSVLTATAVGKTFNWSLAGSPDVTKFSPTSGTVTVNSKGVALVDISYTSTAETKNYSGLEVTFTPTTSSEWVPSTAVTIPFTVQENSATLSVKPSTIVVDEGGTFTFEIHGKNVTSTSVPWSITGLAAPGDVSAISGTAVLNFTGNKYTKTTTLTATANASHFTDKGGSLIVSGASGSPVPITIRNTDAPPITVTPISYSKTEFLPERTQASTMTIGLLQSGNLSTGGTWTSGSAAGWVIVVDSWATTVASHIPTGGFIFEQYVRSRSASATLRNAGNTLSVDGRYATIVKFPSNPSSDFFLYNSRATVTITGTYHAEKGSISSNQSTFSLTYTPFNDTRDDVFDIGQININGPGAV